MSVEHDDLSSRERRVQELLQGMPQPTAPSAFRERLKEQFVAGAIPETRRVSHRGRPRWIGVAVPLAAAAALILMFSVLNRGPQWSMVEGEGLAIIDGVTVSLGDARAVEPLLRAGVLVELESGARACFLQGDVVLAELTSGSRVTLPNPPGRWLGRHMEGTVHAGVVRWVTGTAFPGHRLTLTTPESMVEVTGTCFTLMCTDTGTCVCVLEGDVRVVDPIAGSNMVHGGKRKTMFRTGEAPEFGNMHENERGELIRLSQLIEQNSSD